MTKPEKILIGAVVLGILGPTATVAAVRQAAGWIFDDSGWLFGQPGGFWAMWLFVVAQLVILFVSRSRSLTKGECVGWGLNFFIVQGPLLFLALNDALNVAFAVGCVTLLAMILVVFVYGMHRPRAKSLTWGEAFVAAWFVTGMIILIYAVIPNQFLFWADNELRWRKDAIGIPNPTGEPFFAEGIDVLGFIGPGRGRVIVPAETVRDIIVTTIYVVGLAGNLILWSWWQRRRPPGEVVAEEKPQEETSPYGRPLVRQA